MALSNIFQFQSDLKKNANNPEAVNIIRHAILTGLKSYKEKFGSEYGDLVITCDGKNYWRKDIFPYYKAHRKSAREKSDLDWKLIFNTISDISDDLDKYFPYKVIRLDKIESDDIIATICKWTQTNGTVDHGMFEDKQKVLIISSDGDFAQLQKYDNVKQWSPIQKKMIYCKNPREALIEKICCGDPGDGFGNILSDDDVFVNEEKRQKPFKKARLAEFYELGINACKNDQEKRNYQRNESLASFEMIPQEIQQRIIEAYETVKPKVTKQSVLNYLVKHKCRLLLNDIEGFF